MNEVYLLVLSKLQKHHLLEALDKEIIRLDQTNEAEDVRTMRVLTEVKELLLSAKETTDVEWLVFNQAYWAERDFSRTGLSVMKVSDRKSQVLHTAFWGGVTRTTTVSRKIAHELAGEICLGLQRGNLKKELEIYLE